MIKCIQYLKSFIPTRETFVIFKGIITALITPFDNSNKLDFVSLKLLIEKQMSSAVDGIVIAGSTGEGNMLSESEYYDLIEHAVEYNQSNIPIIATISSTSTDQAIARLDRLNSMKIDGLLCTSPHYVVPEQDGLFDHFRHLNDNTTLPIMLYNHPGRTGVALSDETIVKLAKLNNINAIKDGSGDISRLLRLSHLTKNHDFRFFAADDTMLLPYHGVGGSGVVSVISNIFPKMLKKIYDLASRSRLAEAIELTTQLLSIIDLLSSKPNPVGIKYAISKLTLSHDHVRLPLMAIADKSLKDKIDAALERMMTLEHRININDHV